MPTTDNNHDIVLTVALNTGTAEKQCESLDDILQNFNSSLADILKTSEKSFESADKKLRKLGLRINQEASKVVEARNKLNSFSHETARAESRDMKILENEYETYEKSLAKLDERISVLKAKRNDLYNRDDDLNEKEKQELESLTEQYNKIKKAMADIATKQADLLDTPFKFGENAEFDKLVRDFANAYDNLMELQKELNDGLTYEEEKANELERSANEINTSVSDIKDNMSDMDISKKFGFTAALKKIKLLALGVLGIRSAYATIRRLASQNEQLSRATSAIWAGLGALIEPVFNRIANLIMTILKSLDYIYQKFTGSSFMAKAMEKSMKNTAGSAKEIKNQLAGFDEMNVLSDTSTSSDTTSWVSDYENLDINKFEGFLDKLMEVLPQIGILISGIIGIWLIGKLLPLLAETLAEIDMINTLIESGQTNILAGIALIIGGILVTIIALVRYLKDPTWENFAKILLGISIILAGIALITGSWGVAIAGVIVAIMALMAYIHDELEDFIQSLQDEVNNVINFITNKMNNSTSVWGKIFWGFLAGLVTFISKTVINIINLFGNLSINIRQIFDGILLLFKGKFKEGFVSIFKGIVNTIVDALNFLISSVNGILSPLGSVVSWFGKLMDKSWSFNLKIPNIPKLAQGAVIPPNKEFLAVLGDQKSGTNIEAPLDTIVEAMEKALVNFNGVGGDINVNLVVDGKVLAKTVAKYNNQLSFSGNGGIR